MMHQEENLDIYQELHTRLVFSEIALEVSLQLIDSTITTFTSKISDVLEICRSATNSDYCRIIIFSGTSKNTDISFPAQASYVAPIYERLLYNMDINEVMSFVSSNNFIPVKGEQITDCRFGEAGVCSHCNYLVIPISRNTAFNYSGFIELQFTKDVSSGCSTLVEFIRMIGVLLLSTVRRIEAEREIIKEKNALSDAIMLTTNTLKRQLEVRKATAINVY
jgi:hypothetical protein